MPRTFAVLCLFVLSGSVSAGEWIDLIASPPATTWQGKTDAWVWAEAVAVADDNPRKLAPTGTGAILVNGNKGNAPDLLTRQKWADLEIECEFMLPKGSNSGLKFHGHYEIQIADSFGSTKKLSGSDCGGIYPRAELKPKYRHLDEGIAPKENACGKPGTWQTLVVRFRGPRFDAAGKKTTNARIERAELNGKVIHADQEMTTPTGHACTKPELASGPLLVQGDHGPIALRKLRVREPKAE